MSWNTVLISAAVTRHMIKAYRHISNLLARICGEASGGSEYVRGPNDVVVTGAFDTEVGGRRSRSIITKTPCSAVQRPLSLAVGLFDISGRSARP
jgi:hypothetical protein